MSVDGEKFSLDNPDVRFDTNIHMMIHVKPLLERYKKLKGNKNFDPKSDSVYYLKYQYSYCLSYVYTLLNVPLDVIEWPNPVINLEPDSDLRRHVPLPEMADLVKELIKVKGPLIDEMSSLLDLTKITEKVMELVGNDCFYEKEPLRSRTNSIGADKLNYSSETFRKSLRFIDQEFKVAWETWTNMLFRYGGSYQDRAMSKSESLFLLFGMVGNPAHNDMFKYLDYDETISGNSDKITAECSDHLVIDATNILSIMYSHKTYETIDEGFDRSDPIMMRNYLLSCFNLPPQNFKINSLKPIPKTLIHLAISHDAPTQTNYLLEGENSILYFYYKKTDQFNVLNFHLILSSSKYIQEVLNTEEYTHTEKKTIAKNLDDFATIYINMFLWIIKIIIFYRLRYGTQFPTLDSILINYFASLNQDYQMDAAGILKSEEKMMDYAIDYNLNFNRPLSGDLHRDVSAMRCVCHPKKEINMKTYAKRKSSYYGDRRSVHDYYICTRATSAIFNRPLYLFPQPFTLRIQRMLNSLIPRIKVLETFKTSDQMKMVVEIESMGLSLPKSINLTLKELYKVLDGLKLTKNPELTVEDFIKLPLRTQIKINAARQLLGKTTYNIDIPVNQKTSQKSSLTSFLKQQLPPVSLPPAPIKQQLPQASLSAVPPPTKTQKRAAQRKKAKEKRLSQSLEANSVGGSRKKTTKRSRKKYTKRKPKKKLNC